MNEALELANRKIADLEAKMKALLGKDEELRLLPNGDLHRGIKLENFAQPNIEAEVIPSTFGNPLNRIMSDVLKAAKGGHALTCLHCGLQWNGNGAEKDVREHYKKDHPSIVEG